MNLGIRKIRTDKPCLALIVACLQWAWPLSGNAAEMEVRPGVRGQWLDAGEAPSQPSAWQAQWVWMGEENSGDAMLARRSFELTAVPEKASLRITASSMYQLHVNGAYVCRGPARSAPHHQSFDVLDISGLLHQGRNALAVRVHYQRGTISHHHEGRPGLLVQLDMPMGAKDTQLATDSDWKVHPDASWDSEAPYISRFHLEVSDRVDLQKRILDWQTVGFDDSTWPAATPLIRNVGWPSPQMNDPPRSLIPPWTSLVSRDLPYLKETEVKAVELIEAIPLENKNLDDVSLSRRIDRRIASGLPAYQAGNEPLAIPEQDSSQSWFLLFDLGEPMNGMPSLDIQGPSGTSVEMHCAPFMVDDRFTAKIVDSNLIDRLVLSGKRDLWEATYFKPTRYLGVVIRGGEGPIKLHRAGIRRMEYPFEEQGYFRAPDNPWLEACWQAAAKTIRVCTTDAYTDNYRERRQYAQTAYYAALGNNFLFGDTALQRRYLIQVADEQEANGMMPAYAPRHGDDFMVILDSNTSWIRGLHDYVLYSGDKDTAQDLLPAARKLMGLLHSYTNLLGLFDNPPYSYWLDHALNDRRGANVCMNGHYLGALEDFAQLLDWLDEPGADVFQVRADRLRKALREYAWDPERKLFADAVIDGKRSDQFSEHANAMMLVLEVASPGQAKAVAGQLLAKDPHDFIRRESGLTMVTPAVSYFLHAGLCKNGYVEESLRMFQDRFDRMLQPDTNGTLWEEWWRNGTGRTGVLQRGRTRSDAQTESAFPPALFTEYLLGIRPTQPGLKEVSLFRSKSGLRQIEGAVPSPEGLLEVNWSFSEAGGGTLDVTVPGEMRLNIDRASLGEPTGGSLLVDGRSVQSAGAYLTLTKGKHHVQF